MSIKYPETPGLLQVCLLEVSPGLRYTELRVQVFCCWRPSPSQRAHKLHKAALWLLPSSLSWLCLPLLTTPGRGSGRRSACTEEHTGRVNTAPIARWGPGCPAVAPLWPRFDSPLSPSCCWSLTRWPGRTWRRPDLARRTRCASPPAHLRLWRRWARRWLPGRRRPPGSAAAWLDANDG